MTAQHHLAAAVARIRRLEVELESLKELVCEDVLTHCLNRRGLQQALQRESARGVRQLQPLCVALLDLDDFKRVNDQWGHQAGDEALIHLVQVARASLRSTDLLGRYGGEEFMVVMPNTSMQAAKNAIARIQRALTEAPLAFGATQLTLTFNADVTMQNSDEDSDATAERADQALYSAKRNGKNRIVTTY